MTNEQNITDVPVSNWTLATRTKPGARDVYWGTSPGTVRHIARATTSAQAPCDTSR